MKKGKTLIKTYVYSAAKAPCKSLPYMYGLIDKSVLEVILQTCNKIDIPPKPSKNALKIMLIESFFDAIQDIELIPFVISKKPLIRGAIKSELIPTKLKNGAVKLDTALRIPLDFRIDIILENITTKPPINKIVEILLVILSDIISPKFEKEATLLAFVLLDEMVVLNGFDVLLYFQNLKIKPTVMHARMCVIKSKIPMAVFLNIKIPTEPMIKRGPELFVKASNLSHSSLLQILFNLKLLAIFAPTG